MRAGLNTLDFKSVDSYCNRFLNEVHGNDQTPVLPDCRKNTFDPVQSPAPNSHPFANAKEFVRRGMNEMGNDRVKTLDLLVRNRCSAPSRADKPDDASSLENPQARLCGGEQLHKHVPRKHGYLNPLVAVAPAPSLAVKRKKTASSFLLQF